MTTHVRSSIYGLLCVPGKTALHWAAAVNNAEATLVLLQHGANRDAQDQKVGYKDALFQLCHIARHKALFPTKKY